MNIIRLRDELGLGWDEIACRLGVHKEAARAKYRRMKGTHEKKEEKQPLGVEYEEQGNDAVASVEGRVVYTLEQLLGLCQVDREVWEVERYAVNSWGQHSGDAGYVTLYQVKAWLRRRVPIVTEWPVVQPLKFDCQYRKSEGVVDGLGVALVIPDSQTGFWRDFEHGRLYPFHDRKAIDITLQVAEDLQPDVVVFLGDDLDLPDWTNKFSRTPEFYWTTQPALVERAWWLGQYRQACKNAKMVWIEGNHEARAQVYISENTAASYGLKVVNDLDGPPVMSIPHLMSLDELGVEWVDDYPNGRFWINDNLVCEHGDRALGGSGRTVAAIVGDIRHSVIFGHIHRVELASKTAFPRKGDRTYVAISPGTVARVDGAVPPQKKRMNWQQGFCIVRYETGDGIFSQELVNIYGGRAVVNGRVYEGRDRVGDINQDTGNRYIF